MLIFSSGSWKKFLMIPLMVLLLLCGNFATSYNKTQAVGWVIPAGIEVGAGAYVLSALAIAGIAGAVGYSEYEEEISAHASKVWEGANDVVKQSLYSSIVTAVELGQTTIQLGDEFKTWYADTFVNEFSTSFEADFPISNTESNEYYQASGFSMSTFTGTNSLGLTYIQINLQGSNGASWTGTSSSGVINTKTSAWIQFNPVTEGHSNEYKTYSVDIPGQRIYLGSAPGTIDMNGSIGYFLGLIERLTIDNGMSFSLSVPKAPDTTVPVDHYANQVGNRVENVMNHAINQGVSLPFNDLVAYAPDGQVLTYDPTISGWTLPDGSLFDGTKEWKFPIPNVTTNPDGTVVSNPTTGLPETTVTTGDGVITDPITGTFDPPITSNPPITGDPVAPPLTTTPEGLLSIKEFFEILNNAFNAKYPIFGEIGSLYNISSNSCSRWDGLTASGLGVGGVSLGSLTIVDAQYVNGVAPKIKIWLAGIIWFFLGLYIIRKMSVVWGAGKGGGD